VVVVDGTDVVVTFETAITCETAEIGGVIGCTKAGSQVRADGDSSAAIRPARSLRKTGRLDPPGMICSVCC
jgi:hypothetical protein